MNDKPVEAEATGIEYTTDPCRFCGGQVVKPKRRGLVKLFCRDRCRAAFRDRNIQEAIDNARSVMVEVQDEQERLNARLEGALRQLQAAMGPPKQMRVEENKVVDTVSPSGI